MRRLLFALILFLSSCSTTQQHVVARSKQTPFFIEIPIEKFSVIQTPCVAVQIDDQQLSMELDLGFRGDLSIEETCLNTIAEKKFLYNRTTHGMRGKQYKIPVFRIPKIKIGKMSFLKPSAQQESREFIQDSIIAADGIESIETGRLGWELFQKANLLIDVKNHKIAFCDSVLTLKNQKYPIDDFVKTPLMLDNGLVQLSVNADGKTLYCMLDTGATWNILNHELQSDKPLDKAIFDPENIVEMSSLKIDSREFGPLTFHCMPIHLPFCVDAILGMEFLEENLVFLDFREKQAYIWKSY